MGFYVVAFPSNASNFCPQQAVSPSYIHRNTVSLSHSHIEVSWTPPNGRKRQEIEFILTDAGWYVTDTTYWGCHVNYVEVRRVLIRLYNIHTYIHTYIHIIQVFTITAGTATKL
jgi:hypothetical protein